MKHTFYKPPALAGGLLFVKGLLKPISISALHTLLQCHRAQHVLCKV